VAETLLALETFHNSQITVTIALPPPAKGGMLVVTAKAARRVNGNVAAVASVSRSRPIGSTDSAMGVAGIFRLLYELDLDCGQMWSQEELFK
jgi:hypothetical protein